MDSNLSFSIETLEPIPFPLPEDLQRFIEKAGDLMREAITIELMRKEGRLRWHGEL